MGRMFETPILPRLSELLQEVRDGTIQIPEFQRGYVWSDDDRLRLMDSIWQGIPIGSLLVWRTAVDKGIQVKTQIGPCKLPNARVAGVGNYLVDGLQRITTLYAALMFPEGEERDADGRRWPIYFDLSPKPGDDLRFCLRRGFQEVPPTWMPLSCILDDDRFLGFRTQLVASGHKELLQEARRLESRFRDYVIPVVPLVSDDQELVTEAYSRINSKGEDLDEGDMVHAGSLGRGGNFRFNQEMATTTEQLSSFGWEGIERKTLIAALKAIWDLDLYKSGAKRMLSKLDSQENRHLIQLLPEIFEPVADLLRTFGVYGPGGLPYAYQLVALIRASHRLGGNKLKIAAERLRKWFFWTTYSEHFTGMTSGRLRMEFDRVEALILGKQHFDWIPTPHVAPLVGLRANAVRSRAAVLVMAIAGDKQVGGDRQQRLYGSRGTHALHRLFADQGAENLSNRVLATDDELKSLRAWALESTLNLLFFGKSYDDDLILRNLLDSPTDNESRVPSSLLQTRAARLQREEQAFVSELDAVWGPEQSV